MFTLKNSFCLMSWIEVAAYFSERIFSNSKGKNQMSAYCFSICCFPLWPRNHHNFSTTSIFPFMNLQGILIIFYNKLLYWFSEFPKLFALFLFVYFKPTTNHLPWIRLVIIKTTYEISFYKELSHHSKKTMLRKIMF